MEGIEMKYYFLALATAVVVCVGCAYDGQQILDRKEYSAPPAAQLQRPGPMVDGPGPGVLQLMSHKVPQHQAFVSRTTQVRFVAPKAMTIGWMIQGGFAENQLNTPGTHDFRQGATYRLKLTNIADRPTLGALYPTLQVYPTHPTTDAYLSHNSIPIELDDKDLDQIESNNFVTKVIYLPDPKNQELAIAGVETLVSTRLDPGVDPVAAADQRGTILVVLRVGNKKLEMGGKALGPGGAAMPGGINQVSYRVLDGKDGQHAEPMPIGPAGGGMHGIPHPMIVAGSGRPGMPGMHPVAGMGSIPAWGMPMTGTPIGLPGPPHLPLGGPAGLRRHTIVNNTKVDIGKPVQMASHSAPATIRINDAQRLPRAGVSPSAIEFTPAQPREPSRQGDVQLSGYSQPGGPPSGIHHLAMQYPDEYLFDGGDRERPVHYDRYHRLGLDTEDTVAEYSDHKGKHQVKKSNRVAVYAPRFGAVRTVSNPITGVAVNRASGAQLTTHGAGLLARSATITHVKKDQADGILMRSRASGLAGKTARVAVKQSMTLAAHDKMQNLFENLAFIKTGRLGTADEAHIAAGIQAATTWSRDRFPIILGGLDAVKGVESTQSFKNIVGVDDSHKQDGRLRIVKLADRKSAVPGEIITFTIRYDNLGDRPVKNVRIVDNLTPRLEYLEGTATDNADVKFTKQDNGEGSQLLKFELRNPLDGGKGGVVTLMNSNETTRIGVDAVRWQRMLDVAKQLCDDDTIPSLALCAGRADCVSDVHRFGRQKLNAPEAIRDDAIFLIASITKPIVATAALMLVERGELMLGDRVCDVIPEFGGAGRYGITLRHLLTHTSGLPDMLPENAELRAANEPLSTFVKKTCGEEPAFPPGRGVRYQSMGFALLGEIVARVSGRSCPQFLREEIFLPLGMRDTELGTPDEWYSPGFSADGSAKVDRIPEIRLPEGQSPDDGWNWNSRYWRSLGAPWGGLLTTPTDLSHFARMMLAEGEWEGTRILSRAGVRTATCNQLDALRGVPEDDRRAFSKLGKIVSQKFDEAQKALDEAQKRLDKVMKEAKLTDRYPTVRTIKRSLLSQRNRLLKAQGKPTEEKPAANAITFEKHVAPILNRSCARCHTNNARGGLRIDRVASLMKSVTPGKAAESNLIKRLIATGNERMPKGGRPLSRTEIQTIAAWINQGAKSAAATPGKKTPGPVAKVSIAKPTGNETVSFSKDIAPFMVNLCLNCHNDRRKSGGLSIATFEKMMQGGKSGRVILPGDLDGSRMWDLVGKQRPFKMPRGQALITRSNHANLKKWIAEGAKYDGGDPKKALRSLVPTEEELKRERFAKMTPVEFAQYRRARTEETWKRVLSKEMPRSVESKEFFVYGNVSAARLEEIDKWAEEHADNLRKLFRDKTELLFKGKLTIFVMKDRFGYEEFNQVIQRRRVPREMIGHSVVDPIFEDAYIVLQNIEGDASETNPGMKVNLIDHLTGAFMKRSGGRLPDWVLRGTGLALAAKADPKNIYIDGLRSRVPDILKNVQTPESIFANGTFSPVDVGAIGYTLVDYLLRGGSTKFGRFIAAIQGGSNVGAAMKRVYQADLKQMARAYAIQGVAVRVFEKGQFGREASWAGAGILPPGNHESARTAEARLRSESHRLWPGWNRRLCEETRIDTGFRTCGGLTLRLNGAAGELDDEAASWRGEGVEVEVPTPEQARALEPALSPEVSAVFRLPQLGQVRNPRYLKALAAACLQRGVVLSPGHPVTSFDVEKERVTAVRTVGGRHSAGHYCVAGGAWSRSLLETVGAKIAVEPVRGQIVMLAAAPGCFRHVIEVGRRYLVPRPDGRVLIGSTEESVGFDKRNTACAISELIDFAVSLVPSLAEATFERAWAGLRPGTDADVPYLCRLPEFENLTLAAGHFRSGLQMSPGTAQFMRQLILEQETTLPQEPFAIGRSQLQ
eukprot:g21882.t1